ncbi:MAG: 4Fe-4S binding protein, partial [Clostridia bacterium]|nr:4Fe-4S binding protein [Clostridia bacterium]
MLLTEERLRRGRAALIECTEPGCNICLSACGFSAISRGEDGLPFSDPEKCVGCGGCVAVCPHGSVRLLRDKGAGEYEVT